MSPKAQAGKTRADELSPTGIAQALKTCAGELSPIAQALKTCADETGETCVAHVAPVAHSGKMS